MYWGDCGRYVAFLDCSVPAEDNSSRPLRLNERDCVSRLLRLRSRRFQMTRLNGWRTICGALSVCVAMANPGHAQTFRTLFIFDVAYGNQPTASLAQGIDGNLYGTTLGGGSPVQQTGVLFRVGAEGSFRVLHYFCSQEGCPGGNFPWAGLLLASDGNFYGTTSSGANNPECEFWGCGAIFKVTPADEFTTVYKFHPGA